MTLIVARQKGSRIAIVSDTQLSLHGNALPPLNGILKSCLLANGICVSFAGSPELATREIWEFSKLHPLEAGYEETISFFESASKRTENEFIIAFSKMPKLMKITQGQRQSSISPTIWIGDKQGYELFRELEAGARLKPQAGRTMSAILMAGDGEKSLASDLYSTMRNVILDNRLNHVGGFTAVVSNTANGFHFPCLSDIFYDWPSGKNDHFDLVYNDQINFGSSGENAEFSVSMFTCGYANLSLVGFYMLKGRLAYLFAPNRTMIGDKCVMIKDCDPNSLPKRLTEVFGIDMRWRVWIAGPSNLKTSTFFRSNQTPADGGVQLEFQMHYNTFIDDKNSPILPALTMNFLGP